MTSHVTLPVVVGVDGSESARIAVRWAAVEAALHDAPLHLVYVIGAPLDNGPGITTVPVRYETFREAGEDALDEAIQVATGAVADRGGVEMARFVVGGMPIPVLTERSKQARLLVVGSRGLGAIRRGLLGSVGAAVSRHAHCSVAVIPDHDRVDRSAGAVVVGVEGADADVDVVALTVAFDEAAHRDAELVAMHVWTMGGITSAAALRAECDMLLSERLAVFRERHPEVRTRQVVAEDSPVKRLREASDEAQLLVVGTHDSGWAAELISGSVSQAVTHHATCPVVIARSAESK
ncbi:MAG: universal stress protein [Mycobacteriaceae bacterium]|nr:universal stress protein [Mycobacteriaceae bacterium]